MQPLTAMAVSGGDQLPDRGSQSKVTSLWGLGLLKKKDTKGQQGAAASSQVHLMAEPAVVETVKKQQPTAAGQKKQLSKLTSLFKHKKRSR